MNKCNQKNIIKPDIEDYVAFSHCATVGFAIESANTVGYTGSTSGADNNFITVPFNAVGYNTADIQQIGISDGGAGGIGWGTESFSIWAGVPTTVEGSGFFYWDASMDPAGEATGYYWGDDTCAKATFSIAPGQGVVVNCAEDLAFNTAGDVPMSTVSFTTIADNNFTGNPFPSAIDIQAISISDGDQGTIGWGTESFSIWAGVPTTVEGSGFFYWDASMDPAGEATTYYWGDDTCAKATYSIPAGQGVVINCAADLTVSIEPPYSL